MDVDMKHPTSSQGTRRRRHPQQREKAVALIGALTLAYTAWGFGGVIAWSLHIMLAGGLLTFAFAAFPLRRERGARSGERGAGSKERGAGTQHPASRIPHLLTSFAFYFAAAFLAYLAIAALNPAWRIASDSRGWWLEAVAPPLGAWLPISVEAAYEPMNAWRIFNMHLAAFSLAFGLRVGLRRRRSILFVLWTFLGSTALMALVAVAQKYTGTDQVLWTLKSENPQFWGSFFYRNQGTAFLNWGLVVAGVLYFYHARRSHDEARSGGPHFLAFCLIGLIAASVGLALSRGGILFAGALSGLFLLFVIVDYIRATRQSPLTIVLPLSLVLLLLLSIGLFQVNRAIDWQAVEQRFGDIGATIENADRDSRVLSSRATWRMAEEALWTGWGAGSFRYAFPMYQKEVNELFYQYHHGNKGWTGRKFFRYAHNDILQFLAEYGIIGSGLLLLAIGGLLWPARLALRYAPFAVLFLIAGIVAAMGHAFLDFIFHSPAYWVAFVAGIALSSQLLALSARRG